MYMGLSRPDMYGFVFAYSTAMAKEMIKPMYTTEDPVTGKLAAMPAKNSVTINCTISNHLRRGGNGNMKRQFQK